MAVHLNARLKTRFIPYLFTLAILLVVTETLAHAGSDSSSSVYEGEGEDMPLAPSLSVTRQELQAVMSEGTDPDRLDRRPGFSDTIIAPRPGEHPTTGSLSARKEEEPPPGGGSSSGLSSFPANYLDFSDELPAQPGEALPE